MFGLDRALAVLADAEAVVGDQPDVRIARGRLLAARLDPTFADALAVLARGVERFAADDRARILRELIAAFRSAGRFGSRRSTPGSARPAPARSARRARGPVRPGLEGRRRSALPGGAPGRRGQSKGRTGRPLGCSRPKRFSGTPGRETRPTCRRRASRFVAAARGRPHDPVVEFLRGRVDEMAGRSADALHHYRAAFDGGLADRPVEDLFANLPGKSGAAPVAVLRDQLPLVDRLRPDRHRSLIVAVACRYTIRPARRLPAGCAAAAPPADAVSLAWLGRLFARLKLDTAGRGLLPPGRRPARRNRRKAGWRLVAFHAGRGDPAGVEAAAQPRP